MPISPFQQPSSRRNALASLIEEADRRGDTRQLLLLKSQWAHRYGVDSMPALKEPTPLMAVEPIAEVATVDVATEEMAKEDLATVEAVSDDLPAIDQPAIDEPQFEMPENEASGLDHLEPDALEHDQLKLEKPSATEPVLEEGELDLSMDQASAANTDVLGTQGPVAVDPVQDKASPVAQMSSRPLDSVRSISAAVSIPAPPISTPRSLRRWLPGADDQLPKAS